jgi:hypothetical protein
MVFERSKSLLLQTKSFFPYDYYPISNIYCISYNQSLYLEKEKERLSVCLSVCLLFHVFAPYVCIMNKRNNLVSLPLGSLDKFSSLTKMKTKTKTKTETERVLTRVYDISQTFLNPSLGWMLAIKSIFSGLEFLYQKTKEIALTMLEKTHLLKLSNILFRLQSVLFLRELFRNIIPKNRIKLSY